jgi:hypothetical protein
MISSFQVQRGKYWVPWLISYDLLAISACIFFGFLYVNVIYNAFSPDHWLDLRVYENVFNDPYYHYAQLNRTWLSWIKDEPLWYETVLALRSTAWTYAETINLLSIIAISIISYVIYRLSHKKLWTLVLLLNPSTIDLVIAQVRSAFALSILILVFLRPPWILRILLIIAAGTVHTSMYLFGAIYIFLCFYEQNSMRYKFLEYKILHFIISLSIALLISFAIPFVLGAIGDRRVSIKAEVVGVLFSLSWLTILINYYVFSKFDSNIFPGFFYSICVFLGFFSIFTETYGSRYIAVAIPFLVVIIARQPKIPQRVLLLHYGAVIAIYYYFYLIQANLL